MDAVAPRLRLILFMPGIPDYQQRFWQEAFVDTGLAAYTVHGKQINGLSSTKYPDQLLAEMTPDQIAEAQYDFTRWRLDDDWLPEGERYSFAMLDYEPQHRHLEPSNPASAWGWLKMREGYDDTDTVVLRAMLRGMQKAMGELPGGVKLGIYRTPTLAQRPVTDHDEGVAESASDLLAPVDFIWEHRYQDTDIDDPQAHVRELVTGRDVLRVYNKPVYRAIWPGYTHTPEQVVSRLMPAAAAAWLMRDAYLIVWIDIDTPHDLLTHTRNTVALAPHLLRLIEGKNK